MTQQHHDEHIQQVAPVPIAADELPETYKSPLYNRFNSFIPVLQSVQKYSSYTFSAFSFIHGVAVIPTPAISTSISDELISMGRQLYQDPNVEWWLVWGSIGVHVLSGVTIRVIRNVLYKWKHGQKRHRAREAIGDAGEDGGLTGGLAGYAGLPKKTSLVKRYLNLTPLQFAGYFSIPLILFHALQVRVVPSAVEGDSSYINLDFIHNVLMFHQPVWRPLLNWVVYPLLITVTTYHTVYGILWWNGVKNMTLRKWAMNFISLTSLVGVWSLYSIHKMDSNLPSFVQHRFDGYLASFYLS